MEKGLMPYLWVSVSVIGGVFFGVLLGAVLDQWRKAPDYPAVIAEYREADQRNWDLVKKYRRLVDDVERHNAALQAQLAACAAQRAVQEAAPPPAVFGHQQGEKITLFPADTLPMIQMVPGVEPCGEDPFFMADYSVDEHGNEQVRLHPAWPVEWCQGRGP